MPKLLTRKTRIYPPINVPNFKQKHAMLLENTKEVLNDTHIARLYKITKVQQYEFPDNWPTLVIVVGPLPNL